MNEAPIGIIIFFFASKFVKLRSIVADNGTGFVKVGYAGIYYLRHVFLVKSNVYDVRN